MNSGSSAPMLVGLLCSLITWIGAAAQTPQRPQEVYVPGIGIALKAGWRLFVQGGCRFAIPGLWQTTDDGNGAFSKDGNSLSVTTVKITNWSAHKAEIRATFGHVNVHEDSDRRLWIEFSDKQHIDYYIDVANGLSACVGLLEMRGSGTLSADDANRIVDSIGPAPPHWPPDKD